MAESSTYICPNQRIKGVGRQLLLHARVHAESTALTYVIAFVVAHNVGILRISDGAHADPVNNSIRPNFPQRN